MSLNIYANIEPTIICAICKNDLNDYGCDKYCEYPWDVECEKCKTTHKLGQGCKKCTNAN